MVLEETLKSVEVLISYSRPPGKSWVDLSSLSHQAALGTDFLFQATSLFVFCIFEALVTVLKDCTERLSKNIDRLGFLHGTSTDSIQHLHETMKT